MDPGETEKGGWNGNAYRELSAGATGLVPGRGDGGRTEELLGGGEGGFCGKGRWSLKR